MKVWGTRLDSGPPIKQGPRAVVATADVSSQSGRAAKQTVQVCTHTHTRTVRMQEIPVRTKHVYHLQSVPTLVYICIYFPCALGNSTVIHHLIPWQTLRQAPHVHPLTYFSLKKPLVKIVIFPLHMEKLALRDQVTFSKSQSQQAAEVGFNCKRSRPQGQESTVHSFLVPVWTFLLRLCSQTQVR